ncbi:MAG: uracil-DNA glycosylase [Treponema sp.]|jgi:DNA polymerase|nr:uracil-DNA glycosylase [Treponema sp.]
MNAEDKLRLAVLLDTAGDFLRDGHWRDRDAPVFADGADIEGAAIGSTNDTIDTASTANGDTLEAIAAAVRSCTACGLCAMRILAAPGEGAAHPRVLVIGEAPGSEEDEKGRPFIGPAGQLLDRMLASIALSRSTNCFITNTVKCRPPGNRTPLPAETAACAPFLARQIRLLQPAFILCMGRVAAQTMLHTSEGIGHIRGRFFDYRADTADAADRGEPIPLIATYHPSALLREPNLKRPAWEDLKKLLERLQT